MYKILVFVLRKCILSRGYILIRKTDGKCKVILKNINPHEEYKDFESINLYTSNNEIFAEYNTKKPKYVFRKNFNCYLMILRIIFIWVFYVKLLKINYKEGVVKYDDDKRIYEIYIKIKEIEYFLMVNDFNKHNK